MKNMIKRLLAHPNTAHIIVSLIAKYGNVNEIPPWHLAELEKCLDQLERIGGQDDS